MDKTVATGPTADQGLTQAEATRRLAAEGPNELPTSHGRGVLRIALEVVREPMFLLLVGGGITYLVLGEPTDAALLLVAVFGVMGITIVQERRTERALDALRDLSSPRARVIRDGVSTRIPGREVVPGDLVILAEGDRVPADGLLRETRQLSIDESLLTGESVPVRKVADLAATTLGQPGGDDQPSLFSGTLVTSGQGRMEVTATGPASQLGRLGASLEGIATESTPLQRETRRLVRVFAVIGLVACVVVFVAYGVTRGGTTAAWTEGLLAGIALAMGMMPEEFPVILTVFLSIGAWRISRSRVLTRRLPAIETLGAATVLCVDKTGTLTHNRMTLRAVVAAGRSVSITDAPLEPDAHALLTTAALACKVEAFDPMDLAVHAAAKRAPTAEPPAGATIVREHLLSPELLAFTHVWQLPGEADLHIASKGAPEAIAHLCRLDGPAHDALIADVTRLADGGLRVLAVARGRVAPAALPEAHEALSLELAGLLAFEDPLRESVPAAVASCHAAGVRVVMITGDGPTTAQSIARQAGLAAEPVVLTGKELDTLSDEDLAERLRHVHVCARVVPEQKLRLVRAFQASGEVVAMTGDGVNDAPALKAAHIGIAMGGRGTDVAREAASLVLLDDDFAAIPLAIALGRRIYDNIRKAVAFVVAVHVPIAGLSVVPVLVPGWPLLLLPVHIVFLELVIDPACSLVFEAEGPEHDVMARPPRQVGASLFSGRMLAISALQGLSAFAVSLGVYVFTRSRLDPDTARALTFSTLVSAVLALLLANRSWQRSGFAMLLERNLALIGVLVGATVVLSLGLFVPPLRTLFHFGQPAVPHLLLATAVGLACLLWFELLKLSGWLRRT